MPDQYRHIPLPSSRSIRVLHLEPSQDRLAPLRCSLNAVSLDDYPKWDADYTALSYSWDAQRPSCEIECDGGNLLITSNCEAAIRELRDSTDIKILWIDSICIDQSSECIQERNSQVALMGEIYKSAAKVAVWLGESDNRVEIAIRHVMEIAAVPVIEDRESGRDARRVIRDRVRNIASKVSQASEDPIGPLFERSWFHRMWTVQEITLSYVDRTIFRCGSTEFPWSDLMLVLDGLKAERYRWCRWQEATSLQKQFTIYLGVRRYEGVREILDDTGPNVHNEPLVFHILINARGKKATDPKDKIFSLYGLLSELEIPFPAPNYSKSVEDVYREAVISSIDYDKNLYILYHAPSDRRRDGLASWVPDWGEDGWDEEDSRYGLLRSRFAASGPGIPKWRFSEDRSALILVGKLVDTVIFRTDPMPPFPSVEAVAEMIAERSTPGEVDPGRAWRDEIFSVYHQGYSVFKPWVEISQWSDYPTGEPTKEALQRTLINDNPDSNAKAAKNNSFDHWYDIMTLDQLNTVERAINIHTGPEQRIRQEPYLRQICLDAIKDAIPDAQLSFSALKGPASEFHTLAMAFSQKKCFFYTQNCYFGTAPDPLPTPVQPDDRIAVVSGLEMPLLLRPVEGGYRLVTHVYVHGMMYGEAWPETDQSLEEIVLI